MSVKKSELVQAIQTYSTARVSNDPNLVNFAAKLLDGYLEGIEFAPEEGEAEVDFPEDQGFEDAT